MGRYRDQIVAALRAVTIRGPTRYAWLGRTSRSLPASLDAELTASERRSYLVSCLREELYVSFYCHGAPVPARWGEPEPIAADLPLVAAMSEANTGGGSWEPGWTVERLEGGQAVATNARFRARVPVTDCLARTGAVRPGAAVSLRLPNELPELSPGYHTFVSEAVADFASYASVVRVYWNVGRAGGPALVGALTSRLNSAGVPFRLKVANHRVRLDRCDAAVLYLRGDTFGPLAETLREVADALRASLRAEIPAFTLAFAPGVGLAEADRDGESFGFSRCTLLADSIVRAHAQGVRDSEAQLEAVAGRFAEGGVSIDAPYLEPSLAGRHVL